MQLTSQARFNKCKMLNNAISKLRVTFSASEKKIIVFNRMKIIMLPKMGRLWSNRSFKKISIIYRAELTASETTIIIWWRGVILVEWRRFCVGVFLFFPQILTKGFSRKSRISSMKNLHWFSHKMAGKARSSPLITHCGIWNFENSNQLRNSW